MINDYFQNKKKMMTLNLKEAEGYPCVLTKSAGKNLKDYKIYGNSEQDGTPTPTAPIEVTNLGSGSNNIFDVTTAENGTIATLTGLGADANNRCRTGFIHVKAGNYMLSINKELVFGGVCHMYSQADESTWIGTTNNIPSQVLNDRTVKQATVPQDCFIRFVILPGTGSTVTNLSVDTLADYLGQIEEGTTVTEYKPHHYIDVISNGKNVFDKTKFNKIEVFAEYLMWGYQVAYITGLKANTTYKVSIKRYNDTTVNTVPAYLLISGADFSPAAGRFTLVSHPTSRQIDNSPFTTDALGRLTIGAYMSGVYAMTQSKLDAIWENTDVQIEEGTTVTEFEKYNEPVTTTIDLTGHGSLRKILDVSDYIDFKNKKIKRNVNKIVYDGNERWLLNTVLPNVNRFNVVLPNCADILINSKPYTVYATHFNSNISLFEANKILSTNGIMHFRMILWVYTDPTEFPDLVAFKNWLATQYANGTPLEVYYSSLQEDDTEELDNITIPTAKDTCTITAHDEEIESSNIWAKYYKK